MDTREIFFILGIAETKDEDVIRQAYRLKLNMTNPEDDPEGFKRLRMAYEEACLFAKKTEGEPERDTSPGGLWIERVEAVYNSLPSRLSVEKWQALFTDEVCVNLDTCEEAKKRFLVFVMEHYRFSTPVWKMIGEVFAVEETKEEIYNFLPKNFVEYLVYQCEKGDWFPYEMLEGSDEAEYDTFLRIFFEISRKMEDEEYEDVDSLLDEADSLLIYHPYMELERARYLQSEGKGKEAEDILVEILEKIGGQDERGCYIAAAIKWGNGKKEEAAACYEKLLEKTPDHFLSNERLGEYYLEKEEYETAKKYLIEATKIASTPELQDNLHKVNQVLIDKLKAKVEAEPDILKERLELGWCYLQEEDYEKGIGLLKGISPDEENQEEYHNLKGKLYYAMEDYGNALEHIRMWLTCLEAQEAEGEKEIKNRQTRMTTAHTMTSRIYKSRGKEDEKYYQMALDEMELAEVSGQQSFGYQLEKAAIYMDWEKYEECEKTCTAIIEQDSAYFPAYVTRQEAFFKLRDARGVLQDFYQACDLYGGFAKMYELAAEVLIDFQKYDELGNILKRAEENSVTSILLKIMKGKLMRLQAGSKKEASNALNYLEELKDEFVKDQASDQDIASVYCELALCEERMDHSRDAMAMIEEALRRDPDSDRYLWIKANMLRSSEKYGSALELYQVYEDRHQDNDFDNLYYYKGECLAGQGKLQDAIENYEKSLEINPEHRRANNKIARVYTQIMEEKGNDFLFEKALSFANSQLEITDEAYFYIERGLVYMAAGRWEEALADFNVAVEQEPDNTYAYNNMGCVYKYKGDYEQALTVLKKAVEVMPERETALPYGNLGDTYLRLGQYEEAAACYQENIKRFPVNRSNYKGLALVYRYQNKYEQAILTLRKILGENAVEFHREAEAIYVEMEDYGQAAKAIRSMAKRGGCTVSEISRLKAVIYLCRGKLLQAELGLKKAYRTAEKDSEDCAKACALLAFFYSMKNQKEKASQFAQIALAGQGEDFLNNQYCKRNHMFLRGKLYVYAGDKAKAEECFRFLDEAGRCRGCSHCVCVHQIVAKGLLSELSGNHEKAAEFYREAYQYDTGLLECRIKLNRLKKQ